MTRSLSNLFKRYGIREEEENVRVIDYSKLVEQRLAQYTKTADNAGEDGFQDLPVAAAQIKEDPEEILNKAKEEAQTLRDEAQEAADILIQDAKDQSAQILEEAKKTGFEQGYKEGGEKIRLELEATYQEKQKELGLQQEKDYQEKLHELEPQLVDVIASVVERVFHIQFDDRKEILLYLVCNTMENLEGSHNFRIRVAESQKAFLEHHQDEILDRVGNDASVEFIADNALEENQCIIETETGVFDSSLGVQLENLIKDLKSLNS